MVKTVSVPANGTAPQKVSGRHFACISTGGTLTFRVDNSAAQPLTPGTRFAVPKRFQSLLFINGTGGDIDVTFYYGDTEYVASSQQLTGTVNVTPADISSIRGSPTVLDSTGSATIGAGAEVSIAADANRAEVIISNFDPTLSLILRRVSAGVDCVIVPAMTAVVLRTTALVVVYNPGGVGVKCGILRSTWS